MTERLADVALAAVPAHDDEAERAVLGAILLDPSCLAEVEAILTAPEAFYSPSRAVIYTALREVVAAGEPTERVVQRLRETGRLDAAGGASAVSELVGCVPTSANAAYYAGLVAKCATLRAGALAGLRVAAEASAPGPLEERQRAALEHVERARAALAPAEAWVELEPLAPPPPPPLPLEVFPEWLGAWSVGQAERFQVPADWPAWFALAAIATAAQAGHEVEIMSGWREPVGVYLAVSGEVAAGKTPAMDAALAPIREWEAELRAAAAPVVAAARTRAEVAEAERRNAVARAGRATDDGERASAENDAVRAAARASEIVVPAVPILATTNATPEGLVRALDEGGGVASVLSDEGGAFFGVTTGRRYNAGGQATLDEILKAFSGSPIAVKRKIGEPIVIQRPRLTVALGVQPALVATAAADPELAERGVLARFLWSCAGDRVGQRKAPGERAPIDPSLEAAYRHRLRGILGDAEEAARRLGRPRPPARVLRLSREARAELDRLFLELEPRLGPGGDLAGHVRTWVAKQGQGPVARLAALLHLAEDHDLGPEIRAETLRRAVALFRCGAEHAAVALGGGAQGLAPAVKAAERVVAWLRRRPEADRGRVTRRSLGKNGVGLADDAIPAATALLVARGYFRREDAPRGRDGRRQAGSESWRVNPAVYARGGAS